MVADEVRKLAERTAASTGEIATMVGRNQQRTVDAVTEMREGVHKVEDGVRSAHSAGNTVAAIRDAARRVVDTTSEVRLAIKEQSAAATIANNIEQVVRSAEANAGTATQAFNASIQVSGMSTTLNTLAGDAARQGKAKTGNKDDTLDLFNLQRGAAASMPGGDAPWPEAAKKRRPPTSGRGREGRCGCTSRSRKAFPDGNPGNNPDNPSDITS